MKRKMKLLCGFFVLLVFITSSITIYGKESDNDDSDITLAPYFYVENEDESIDNLPLKETKVTANINGVIADIFVVQTYTNEGKKPINAAYVFPASTKVSVHGMKMEIGDKTVTAKIKEREEAKIEFEEAKSEGKSASLLEQQRPNVFTMNVSNIMPGDVVNIELHYTELITSTDGIYQFVFPTVVGPRYSGQTTDNMSETNQWVASPYLKEDTVPDEKYDIKVNLSAGVPIGDLKSKLHNIDIAWESEDVAQVTLSNPEEFAGNRDFILEYKLTGEKIDSGLMLYEGEEENFFMLTVQPPERIIDKAIPPREYIFVLDVSGSMEGYPLDTAKQLIRNLVTNLRETDKFNLILFSGASNQMSPISVDATEANIKSAIEMIDAQDGSGGTELAPALMDAINIPADEHVSRSVIIITDGYISSEGDIFDIISGNLDIANFFSFGIGTSVNRYLIDGIAKAGLGEAFVVTDSYEASATAERFRTYIQSPVLTDIRIIYNDFDVYDVAPTYFPDLFAQRPIVIFGKWRGEPSGEIRISGKTGNDVYINNIQIAETKPSQANSAIRYLWARTKVDTLMGYDVNQDVPYEVKADVTAIGLNYSMMTPYTSFIAVIDTVRNSNKKSTNVNQALPLPQGVSDLSVGGGYTLGSEPDAKILILLISVMFLLSIVFRMRYKKQSIYLVKPENRGVNDDNR